MPSFRSSLQVLGARKISAIDRWGLYLPASFVVLCNLYLANFLLYPGYALSALALAGGILIARAGRSTVSERVIWLAIGAVLLGTEARVLKLGMVGARSYLVCLFGQPSDGEAVVRLRGDTAIHSASMHVVDIFKLEALHEAQTQDIGEYDRAFQNVTLGNFNPDTAKTLGNQAIKLHNGVAHYKIYFDAENGLWWEDYQCHVISGKPVQALRILRYRGSKPEVLFEQAEPGYPRDAANEVDWAWANKEL